jgi:hypothetical protein
MRYFVLFLVFGMLFSGCLGYFEFEQTGEPQLVEAPAPAVETAPVEEAPAGEPVPWDVDVNDFNESAETEPEPEVEEEELVHWDVGVTEEDEEEGSKKLQAVEFDGYALIVDDITDDYPYPCAALRVGDMSGTYIETLFQDKVCPGDSTYWTSPEGARYRIKVFETAAGYAGYAYWADVAVYKQE